MLLRILRKLFFGCPPKQITREELDCTVAMLRGGTLAEAEEFLGISPPFHPSRRRRHLKILSQKERSRRREKVARFLSAT